MVSWFCCILHLGTGCCGPMIVDGHKNVYDENESGKLSGVLLLHDFLHATNIFQHNKLFKRLVKIDNTQEYLFKD